MPAVIGTGFGHSMLYYVSELQAWRKTPAGFITDYRKAHEQLLELLAGVDSDEWGARTVFPGTGKTLTVEDVFCVQVPAHFEAHANEIRVTLKSGS